MTDESTQTASAEATGDHAAAYGDLERQALDHVWIHSANYVELAERRGLKVFDHGKGDARIEFETVREEDDVGERSSR